MIDCEAIADGVIGGGVAAPGDSAITIGDGPQDKSPFKPSITAADTHDGSAGMRWRSLPPPPRERTQEDRARRAVVGDGLDGHGH